MGSQFDPPAPHVRVFVQQVLSAGSTLRTLVEGLADALIENGAEDHAALVDVIEMLMGTVAVRLSSVSEADFARAAELIELTVGAAFADLERAMEHSRRREHRHRRARPRRRAHS